MKKAFVFSLLLALANPGNSQNQRFLKTYQVREGNLYDYINVMGATTSPMYSGVIFVTFYQEDYGESGASHQSLMLLDTAGNLLKTTSYISDNTVSGLNDYFNQSVFIDNHGDIFLSGYVYGQGAWDGEGLLMKVDTNNNVWFAKKIGSWDGEGQYDDDVGITVAKTLNLNSDNPPLFVCGSVDQFAGSTTDKQIPFVAQINKTNGTVSKYTEIETTTSVPYAMYDLPSGNIAVWAREIGSNSLFRDVWIVLDSNLNLLSAPVSYTYSNYNFNQSARTSFFTSDFNQVNAGFCQDTSGKYQMYCYSTTSTGSVNWAKVYSFDAGFLATSQLKMVSMIEKDSALFLMADATINLVPYNDFVLMKINKNTGDIIWVKSEATNYKGQASVYSMDVHSLILKNNSLYIVGNYTKYGPDNSIFLIKSDLDGNWTNDCYDNRDFGNVTSYDATIENTNLPFDIDETFSQTLFTPQVQLFVDTVAEEINPPQAGAVVSDVVCQGALLTITDQSANNYSWNYSYKDCGYWNMGSYSNLPPGTTDNNNILYCPGIDSLKFLAYDVSDNWNNSALCIDSVYYPVNVISSEINLGFTYNISGNTVQFSDTTTGTVRWFWNFDDGNIDTIKDPVHNYNNPGLFNVCLTAVNACGDSATVCKNITVTGIKHTDDNNLKVFPNPAHENIFVLNKNHKILELDLKDLDGRLILNQKLFKNKVSLNIAGLPKGVYLLFIITEKKTCYRKIIKE